MSGFEIAGAVLGSWPIVVGTINLIIDAVEGWKDTERDLESLYQKVNGQKLFFTQHLRDLLESLELSELEIEDLLSNPTDENWRQPNLLDQLKKRLGSHCNPYLSAVRDILLSVQRLTKTLSFDKLFPPGHAEVCNF